MPHPLQKVPHALSPSFPQCLVNYFLPCGKPLFVSITFTSLLMGASLDKAINP